jgi:hypothetical protein
MSELRNNVRNEIAEIYESALRVGYVNDDDICDELHDWFDDVDDSNDAVLKQAYATACSALEKENDVAKELLKAALDLLAA